MIDAALAETVRDLFAGVGMAVVFVLPLLLAIARYERQEDCPESVQAETVDIWDGFDLARERHPMGSGEWST